MASIPAFVGVPKRASCNRCSNPIFLAERISFGAKSYHRSCLKCARCGTQLTVGSFYETETDGEYCCETCPDEEIQLEQQRRESSASPDGTNHTEPVGTGSERKLGPIAAGGVVRNVRSSKLLDRISFFESAPLSDEEKSSNLERKTKMSDFLKETLKDVEQNEDKPPDLPAVGPPSSSVRESLEEAGKAQTIETTEDDEDDSEDDSADEDDVEDEFEKLVQGLEQEDSVSLKLETVSQQPLVEEAGHARENNLQEDITTSTTVVLKDPVVMKDPETNDPQDTILTTNTAIESESISVHSETESKPLDEMIASELTANENAEEPAGEELELEKHSVTEHDVTETTKASELKREQQNDTAEEDKTSDALGERSTEISDEKVIEKEDMVETETLTPTLEPESIPKDSNVPEENESTELKILPGLEVSEHSDSKLMVSDAAKTQEEQTLTKSKVPEEEKEEAKTAPLQANDEVTEVSEVKDKVIEMEEKATSNGEEQYPSDLNPFGDDDDGEANENIVELRQVPGGGAKPVPTMRRVSTNPFGSEDEDDETPQSPAAKPPRPPPPKVKTSKPVPANPFDDDDDDQDEDGVRTEDPEPEIVPVSKPSPRRTPVPTPRKAHAYNDSISSLDNSLMSSSRLSSSNVSLASSLESGPASIVATRRKKGKAPDIPVPQQQQQQQKQNISTASIETTSVENLSNNSGSGTLTTPRKKRLAPAPPPGLSSTPKQSSKLEGAAAASLTRSPSQRLLTVDASLLNNSDREPPLDAENRGTSNDSVVYRRTIVPLVLDDDGPESPLHGISGTSERQWEKMKDNKEAQNRNRQSQSSPTGTGEGHSFGSPGALSILSNKSSQGKWKRRKGPAPALPMPIAAPLPERKPIKMLPLKEIHQELQIIETQQQGLEKQGIVLEKMIRERCEGVGEADIDLDIRLQANSKEVEDLIMQLFELVNEKNELFRRQAELMYLRRMHRLEQEQADLEYEIRLLMAQPERNKTDSDKEKEEALIARLVEIVQLRNEVVECLEMDRIREAEEDLSIKQSIEERAASQQSKHGSSKKDSSASSTALPLTDAEKRDSATKLSKKEKKKLKEAKKLVKSKKIDSEKDADETESTTTKEKKKKRKFLF